MRKLIYPQFIGRLGNNMFQIAACIGYAKKHNVGWGIKKGYRDRGFLVDQIDRFFPHLPECDEQFRGYNEPSFTYQEIPYHPQGVRIVGFWQSLKHFGNAQEEVREAFNLKYIEGYEDYVSVHVRRGDYATNPEHFPPVTSDYIKLAIQEVFNRTGKTFKVKVFSDDLEWCMVTFGGGFYLDHDNKITKSNTHADIKFEYSDDSSEYNDLCIMASCGHNIIANSSFSWWGAFLNRNPNKIVVSPSRENWFGPKNGEYGKTQDIIPENWIQIKY